MNSLAVTPLVGASVGAFDGTAVGLAVLGALVGDSEGRGVGASVVGCELKEYQS